MKTNHLLFLLFFLFVSQSAFTQIKIIGKLDSHDAFAKHLIKLHSGVSLEGRVVNIENSTIYFVQQQDTMLFKDDEIERIIVKKPVQPTKSGSSYPLEGIDTSGTFIIRLNSKSQLQGTLESIEEDHILFKYRQQLIEFRRRDVYQLLNITKERGDTLMVPLDFNKIHGYQNLLASPTSFIAEDHVDYQTHYGLLHLVEFPLNNNVALMTGFSIPDLVIGKLKFATNKRSSRHNVGGGVLFFSSLYTGLGVIVVPHISYTVGVPEQHFNISLGRSWLFGGYGGAERALVLSFGGKLRLSSKWHISSETFLHFNDYGRVVIPSLMFGIVKNKNRFFFGTFLAFDSGYVYPFPLLNYGHAF